MKQTRNWTALVAVVGLLVSWGCGGSGSTPSVSSSTEKVEVKGTVTLKGKPITGGKILFDPANINRRDAPAATFEIGKDGTYSGSTLIGENSVSVSGPAVEKAKLTMNRKAVVLKAGENVVEITLP